MTKKEKINYLKMAGISLLITAGIEFLYYIIGYVSGKFVVTCPLSNLQAGLIYDCSGQTPFKIFLGTVPETAIVIFLITFVIYSLIKIWKK